MCLAAFHTGRATAAAPCPLPPASLSSAEGEDFGTLARWFYARVFPPAACSRIWQEWGKEQSDGGAWNASAGTLCSGLQVDDAGVCAGDSGE